MDIGGSSSGFIALQFLYIVLILAASSACLFVSWTCVSTITLVSSGFSLLDPEAPAGIFHNYFDVSFVVFSFKLLYFKSVLLFAFSYRCTSKEMVSCRNASFKFGAVLHPVG